MKKHLKNRNRNSVKYNYIRSKMDKRTKLPEISVAALADTLRGIGSAVHFTLTEKDLNLRTRIQAFSRLQGGNLYDSRSITISHFNTEIL